MNRALMKDIAARLDIVASRARKVWNGSELGTATFWVAEYPFASYQIVNFRSMGPCRLSLMAWVPWDSGERKFVADGVRNCRSYRERPSSSLAAALLSSPLHPLLGMEQAPSQSS